MEPTGAEFIIGFLEHQGITTIAGIPGGSILPVYDALAVSGIRHILARHEQGAGFVAQGMARSTGKTAACLASSGPGALNLLTALADADRDSVPLVAITGQVETSLLGTRAFQEADMVSLCRSITRRATLVRSAADLPRVLEQAFRTAAGPRPGAVLVDVPKDVQKALLPAPCLPAWWNDPASRQGGRSAGPGLAGGAMPGPAVVSGSGESPDRPGTAPDVSMPGIAGAWKLLCTACKPLIITGGGCIHSPQAPRALADFLDRTGIPVVSTLMGLGALPGSHPLHLGMMGMHGHPGANHALEDCDLVLALGNRFDDRSTGPARLFAPRARIIHVNADSSEPGRILRADLALVADAGGVLRALCGYWDALAEPEARALGAAWDDHARDCRLAAESWHIEEDHAPRWIWDSLPRDTRTVVCTDVGQHQMWTALHWKVPGPRQFLSSGGMGTMGFGLPAATGAALARPGTRVFCISGDGSVMMNLQELALLAELDLDVCILVVNNRHLGLVRQQQDMLYRGRLHSCRHERPTDLVAVARGFGIDARRVQGPGDLGNCLDSWTGGPLLVDIPVGEHARVYPMVEPGKAQIHMRGARRREAACQTVPDPAPCTPW